eukprot:Nitzschia sp. Nitz4//scaffold362_size15054//11541//13181//NITZ4_008902-RA/size15054-processed-gene-0.14-mRNA-1//-1//CDS//3329549250//1565//frame0
MRNLCSWQCLLLLLAATTSTVTSFQSYRAVDILNDVKNDLGTSGVQTSKRNDLKADDDILEQTFLQVLDHFDPLNHATYSQRYFYSDRYVNPQAERQITFLCVGGEGPGFTKSVLIDSDHCTGDMIELAKKLYTDYPISVHMFALEHRYYGESYPDFGPDVSPVTTDNLKYLSSRQALEDLAHFVQTKQQEQGVPMPWVTFGGSYPGFMAGNARLQYPHLIHAAVSNSAPLDLRVDFPGYNARVGWDLKYEKVGGSQTCYDIVKQGHEQAIALVNSNPASLARLFHVCNPDTALDKRENQNLLLGDGLIGIYAQGNDPSCNDTDICSIDKLCHYMVDSLESGNRTELDILVDVASKQRGGSNPAEDDDDGTDADTCMSVDFEQLLKQMADPTVKGFGWRSWLWQTCTEVGFYQACDETCPYGSFYHTVDQDLAICAAAYNITNVYENVQASLAHYGGLNIDAGSRVLSVNGDVDPWSVLGLHTSPKYSLPVAMVAGASHHFWTHAVKETDLPEIVAIREYIYSVVMNWLDIDEKTTSSLRGTASIA